MMGDPVVLRAPKSTPDAIIKLSKDIFIWYFQCGLMVLRTH